jgi:predicted Ser/Thr protein kinase
MAEDVPVIRPAPEASLDASLAELIRSSAGRRLGTGYQASVHLYAGQGAAVVVKKPHASKLLGWLWRALLARERRVYARLRGIGGVPRCYGMLGDDLVLEYVAGPSLRAYEGQIRDRERFFADLLTTLQEMHAAGVAHGDLKRKDNVIVGAGERPYLIDFGIACLRGNSRLYNRYVFEAVRQMDYNAWIKLKYQRRDADVTAADARIYRPLWIERAARVVRVVWQKATLRRPRQRWRRRHRR